MIIDSHILITTVASGHCHCLLACVSPRGCVCEDAHLCVSVRRCVCAGQAVADADQCIY